MTLRLHSQQPPATTTLKSTSGSSRTIKLSFPLQRRFKPLLLATAFISLTFLCRTIILNTSPRTTSQLTTTTGIAHPPTNSETTNLANTAKHSWIPGEHATFVLQQDMNATFFFVEDNPDKGIDPVRSFLLRAETNIRQLFHHLLFRPNCLERERQHPYGASCAPPSTNRKQIVLDIGCNRGWYTFMAASYGHPVYAFDPQPHCHSLLTATVLINGFDKLVNFTQAFVTDIPNFSMQVKRRTGCMGGFPNNNAEGYADRFRKPLDLLPGANHTVEVGSVSLDDMFHPDTDDILLLKMDVEGHESHALKSAHHLLSHNAVRNIIVEFNLPMLSRQPEGITEMKKVSKQLIKQLMVDYGYKVKASHKGDWSTQSEMTFSEWEELFTDSKHMFSTIDAWFYK